jgi:hypothetical protein
LRYRRKRSELRQAPEHIRNLPDDDRELWRRPA